MTQEHRMSNSGEMSQDDQRYFELNLAMKSLKGILSRLQRELFVRCVIGSVCAGLCLDNLRQIFLPHWHVVISTRILIVGGGMFVTLALLAVVQLRTLRKLTKPAREALARSQARLQSRAKS
jgi:hypothetical protein